VGSAGGTPMGLVYCSENRGAWLWNGGNTSQKISNQLADDFFDMGMDNLGTNNYGFFTYAWQKWVMVSNNYMLDSQNNAWWRLMPDIGQSVQGTGIPQALLFWYSQPFMGQQLYCASGYMRKTHNDPWWVLIDNTVPTYAYSWESVPLHVVPDTDRVLDVREVCILASDPQGSGTTSIALTVNGNVISQPSPPTIGTGPTEIRWNVGVKGVQYIQVQILAQNSSTSHSAPIVHSIDIGYEIRAKVASSN
jgi:hypothetical protein